VLKSLGTLDLLDCRTGKSLASLISPRPQEIFRASFSPDGGTLAVLGDSEVQIWDLNRLRLDLSAMGLDWSPPPKQAPGFSTSDLVFRWLPDNTP
jgi:WD40 repeat protein